VSRSSITSAINSIRFIVCKGAVDQGRLWRLLSVSLTRAESHRVYGTRIRSIRVIPTVVGAKVIRVILDRSHEVIYPDRACGKRVDYPIQCISCHNSPFIAEVGAYQGCPVSDYHN
jgi:hypothetical protein